MPLNLTLACELYDRTFALQSGSVKPDGIDLNYLKMNVGELFERQGRHAEFDISEMSLSTYSIMLSYGDRRLIAIPVFPSKVFRHSTIFVHAGAGIREPKDLIGKRVGCIDYQPTALVWQRGFLQHDYGVRPEQMEWYFGGWNQPMADYSPRIPVNLPANLKTKVIPSDQCIDWMLKRGEIDAVIGPIVPTSFRSGSSKVARLFPNYQEVEADYFRRTGMFPIMHTVVIRRDIYERNSWVAMSMYKAFVEAKAYSIAELRRAPGSLFCALPWLEKHLKEMDELVGPDPFAYGLGELNRRTVGAFLQYCHEQGLIKRPLEVDELFAPETLSSSLS